jgi:hypothetical protein
LTLHLSGLSAPTDQHRLDLAVTFVINRMSGVIARWLEAQPQRSAASVFSDFDQLAVEALSAYVP